MDNYDSVKGGHWFRTVRAARGQLLSDIAKRSAEAFGEENRLDESTVSMLERGRTKKPPLPLAARYAYLLGVSPNEVFEAYGLPIYGGATPALHESIRRVITIADRLPPLARERLYAQLEYAATMALDAAQGRTQYLPISESATA